MPRSRAARLKAQILDAYRQAAEGNYSLSGAYIDSTQGFGAMFLLNYDDDDVASTAQNLLFDGAGAPAVLFASDEISFLRNLSAILAARGDALFGNAMYIVPNVHFSSVFEWLFAMGCVSQVHAAAGRRRSRLHLVPSQPPPQSPHVMPCSTRLAVRGGDGQPALALAHVRHAAAARLGRRRVHLPLLLQLSGRQVPRRAAGARVHGPSPRCRLSAAARC